jgi:Phage Terminase
VAEALALLGGLVLDDGRRWAEVAEPWQLADAEAVLDGADAGPRRHFQLRPRGASKTTDAAAVALALLVTEAPPRSRSHAYAVDQDQAGELLDALSGFVTRTPGLAGAVRLEAAKATAVRSEATLQVEASDAASAFGRRPWLLLVDELSQWPRTPNHIRLWGAIVSALPKRADSRLLVISMAGSPTHPAYRVWRRAEASGDWRASQVPGPCPWWSPADVAATRAELTEAEFRQYVLAEWCESDDALTTEGDVVACVTHARPLPPRAGVRYVLSVDVGTRRDRTAVAVAHLEPSPAGRRVVVDRVLRWSGSRLRPVQLGEVEASLLRLHREYHGAPLVFDFHQAAQLTERLRAAGVRCVEYPFTMAGVNRLARVLHGALRDRAIGLPDDPVLLEELQQVRIVQMGPGAVKLANPPGTHDDQAVAVALAAAQLLVRPGVRPASWSGRLMAGTSIW